MNGNSSTRTAKRGARSLGQALLERAAEPARGRQLLQPALLLNAITASDTGGALDTALAHAINTANTNIYDKAIDSAYLSTGVGGSRLHHLIDGQHDLLGAFDVARQAVPNDSLAQEVFGTAHHLGKDLFSVMGLPVVSLKPETYRQSSDWIQQHLGISKSWQADLMQINAMELLGGGLSAAAVVVGARKKDVGALAETAVSTGLAGTLAANPIAMCAGSVALALALRHCQDPEKKREAVQRASVGAASTVTTMAVGKLLGGVAAAGTLPLIGSLALSLTAGMAVRSWLLNRIKVVDANRKPPEAVGADESAKIWHRRVEFQALQIRDHYDEAALALLRKAFQRA